MATVRQQYPAARLVILGNPYPASAYTQQVMAEIKRLKLADTVQIRGFVDDVELLVWYARADVFAMPSMNEGWEFEGFGLVHLEASAAALPVIGARDTGNEDAIEHGVTGYLVSQEGIDDELPRYLLDLLADPALRNRMGQAGRARALRQTWDSVAQQYLALYQDTLTQKGHR
jgi:glycosyltransferase involved in cell wall biosynthesis